MNNDFIIPSEFLSISEIEKDMKPECKMYCNPDGTPMFPKEPEQEVDESEIEWFDNSTSCKGCGCGKCK